MPSGKRIPDAISEGIRKDYYERQMTVAGIVAKYNVSRRAVYDHIKPDRFSPYAAKVKRRMTYLTKDEVELILLLLLECDGMLKGENRVTAKCLEERMLSIADDLTF